MAWRRSISSFILAPVILLVTLAFGVAAMLGYDYGRRSTYELVDRLVAESAAGLSQHLSSYLEQAHQANAASARALQLGVLDETRLFEQPEAWFLAQHRDFQGVDDLYFARNDGSIAGVDKKEDGRFILKLTTTFPQRSFFALDADGQRGLPLRSESYDASKREWFKVAMARNGPTWSPVYVLQNKEALGITAARPALNAHGHVVGVLGANITLRTISDYLSRHPVGPNSMSYIVERNGALVAASLPSAPLAAWSKGKLDRIAADESDEQTVSASHRALAHAALQGARSSGASRFEMDINGTTYRVYQSEFSDALGLDWRLVNVVDPTHFLKSVVAIALTTVWAGLVLLVGLWLMVLKLTRRLAAPIESLNQATRHIADGHYGEQVAPQESSRELTELTASFNHMSEALDVAMSTIQAHGAELEREVGQRTSELQTANHALARAHELALAASEAKTSFLAQMSHEIRTPLSSIASASYLVRSAGLAEEQDQRMNVVEVSSQHILGIVNSVLDIAKIEAGRLSLDLGPVDPRSIIGNVVAMVSDQAAAKGLTLRTRADGLPEGLLGDRIRLQQMLLNYAGNAVKFADAGEVLLVAELLGQDERHARVRFSVTDQGRAIAPENLAKLFTPYEQGDGDQGRKKGGAGLGLAITRQLAELMGGSAGASSTPGQGNTFHFTVDLPLQAVPDRVVQAPSQDDAEMALRTRFNGTRVLVAEDDPVNLLMTQTMLNRIGLVADTARTGREAIDRATANDYAVILMDVQMPEIDGLGATRQIRQLSRHSRTPIIATSAHVFHEDRFRCLQAGMNDFMAKPVELREFFGTLLRWVSRSEGATRMA